jgi:SAM-dependent methyltransferase
MYPELFTRQMIPCQRDPRILTDVNLPDSSYVTNFGFEWTKIDGFIDKEVMSHGHVFGRFLLPDNYFAGKTVVDIGCGNGRIGRIIGPKAYRYIGLDLSEAVYSFPAYLQASNITLGRASATDIPLKDAISDVSVCWGVLHHVDNPVAAISELIRITKPGGEILLFIYSKAYDARENLNRFVKQIDESEKLNLIEFVSDSMDAWREVDLFYANLLSNGMFQSPKQSREWQIFQWFDGITPQYHWNLEKLVESKQRSGGPLLENLGNGCYKLKILNTARP